MVSSFRALAVNRADVGEQLQDDRLFFRGVIAAVGALGVDRAGVGERLQQSEKF
jgi:hypothetical protein